jgi:hypothetical protein
MINIKHKIHEVLQELWLGGPLNIELNRIIQGRLTSIHANIKTNLKCQ